MKIIELKDRRETYGHDERAINKHSIRAYEVSGVKKQKTIEFLLDRTLDGVPPFYSLYIVKPGSALPIHLNVGGQEYWGDGLSWQRAEERAFKVIVAFMETTRS